MTAGIAAGTQVGPPAQRAGGLDRPLRVVGAFPAFDPAVNELAMVWRGLAEAGRIDCRVLAGERDTLKASSAALAQQWPGLSVRRCPGDGARAVRHRALIDWAAALRPDVIVCEVEPMLAVGLAVRRRWHAPVMLHVEHWFDARAVPRRWTLGMPALRGPAQSVRRLLYGRRVDTVLVSNPLERAAIAAAGPRHAYAPWPHPPAADVPPAPRSGRDLARVAYIGSMSRWKGVEALCAALARLFEAEPGARATIVGPTTDAVARRELDALLARWPARIERIERLPRDAATAVLRGALCALVPSGSMGWGLIGDAWHAGTPVLGLAPFYDLQADRNALLAEGEEGIVDAYRRLRDDAALWDRLAAGGLATVRDGHSVEAHARALMDALHATANRR